jgi:hypothetical protein
MEKILLILVGLVTLCFSGRFLIDPVFARKYIAESPKAYIWRKVLGADNAMKLTRLFFAPIGVALALFLIIFGMIK